MTIYSDPVKYGLATVGEIEWSNGWYQFDLTVVFHDPATGLLYYAEDSGCSCPIAFDEQGRDNLTLIDRPQALIDHLAQRQQGRDYDVECDQDEIVRTTAAIGALVQKVREVLR